MWGKNRRRDKPDNGAKGREISFFCEGCFSELFNSIKDAILIADPVTRALLDCNKGAEKLLGRPKKEIISMTADQLHPVSVVNETMGMFGRLASGEDITVNTLILNGDGRSVPVSVNASFITINGKKRVVGTFRDMSEYVMAQKELESEASFRAAVIKNAAEGIAVCHEVAEFPFVNFTVWNDRMAEITGYSMEEINKNGWYQAVYPDLEYQEKARQRMGRMRQGDNLRNEEWVITRQDGNKRTLQISTGVINGPEGKVHVMAMMHDITEERAYREQMLDLSRFPSENPSPVLRVGIGGDIRYANAAAEAEVLGPCKCGLGGSLPEQWKVHIRIAFESNEKKAGEFEARCGDRTYSFIIAIFKGSGYANLYGRDITERKASEAALLSLNSLLSSTIESAFDGILVVDRHGKIVRFNRKFIEMWGIPQVILDSGEDKQALDFVLSQLNDPEGFMHKVRELYNDIERESYDLLEFKDGRTFERYSRPQKIDNDVVGRVWTFHDVTERKELEKRIIQERDLAQKYLDLSNIMFVIIGSDENTVLVNQKACEVLGWSKEEIIGKNWFDNFVPEADREKTRSVFHRLMRGEIGLFGYNENKVLTRRGEKLVAWNNTWLKDAAGNVTATLSSGEDITDKRRAEEALESSERLYRLLADNIMDFVWTADMDFNFSYLSPSVFKLLGYKPEELEYKNASFVITPGSLAEGMRVFSEELKIEAAGNVDFNRTRILRFEHVRKDGSLLWVEANITFLRDEYHKPIGIMGICRDINERVNLEKDFRKHLERLESFYKTKEGGDALVLEMRDEMAKLRKALGIV